MKANRCVKLFLSLTLIGAAAGAAPAADLLIQQGSTWKYLDNGSDQGTAWRAPSFDDSFWAQGPAELGYGDGGEATIVNSGPSTDRFVTTYFRHTFNVTDPSAYLGLFLQVLRDDGVVVYLNGVEVFRNNMPGGTIAYDTFASSALGGADETTFVDAPVGTDQLLSGVNVMSVEIHQANSTSSDISFDLQLSGTDSTFITRGPYLQQATPTSLIIRWRTGVAGESWVRYGIDPGNLAQLAGAATSTTEHIVTVTGLQPNTLYYYELGDGSSWAARQPVDYFVTPPPVGTAQPTRIWVVGDSGTADLNAWTVQEAYLNYAATRPADLWLMLGDNAYNSGTDTEFQNAVFNMYANILPNTPLWSTRGNHESDVNGSGSTYYNIFTLPTGGEAGGVQSGTEAYYSFDYANIHFICLDSQGSSRSSSGTMATWLQNDLAATLQDWVIAFWHHPPYSKGSHNSDTEGPLVDMRQNLLPILEGAGVDLVLCGHSHSYERSCLLDGHYGTSDTLTSGMKLDGGDGREDGTGAYEKATLGAAAHEGAVYIVAGSSGKISGGTLNHPAMFISLNQLGSVILDVNGNRLDARFLRETGAIDDYFTIIKGGTATEPPTAPTGLVATAGEGQAALSWNASSGADTYTVKRSISSGEPYEDIPASGLTSTSYTDTDVVNGTPYFYVVSAVNESGESPNSNEAVATPNINNPPIAWDDAYGMDEDQTLNISAPGVLANDSDPDGHPLTALLVAGTSNGSLQLNANGSFSFTPNPEFSGADSFQYQATDGAKASGPATVSLTVNPVNDAPVAVDDAASTITDTSVTIDVLNNDSDVENDPLTVIGVSTPGNGSATINPDGTIHYAPNAGFTGQDSFNYTISDGGASDIATVTVDVEKLLLFSDDFESGGFTEGGWVVASGPASVDASAAFAGNGGALLKKNASMTKSFNSLTATEVEISYWRRVDRLSGGEALVVEISENGQTWIALESVGGTTSWANFTDTVALNGSALHLRFRLNGNAGNDAAMIDDVEIGHAASGTAPTANGDAYNASEDLALNVAAPGVLSNDTDPEGDPLTAVLVDNASNGTVVLNGNGSFTYTPDADFHGTDNFTYAAGDGTAQSAPVTVTITVDPVNDAPSAANDSFSVEEKTILNVTAPGVLGNDSDVDGDTLTASLESPAANGGVSVNSDGSFTYTPNASFLGEDSFTYSANDGNSGSSIATVTVIVTEANEAPVGENDSYTINEDGALAITAPGVLSNDSDADMDPLTAVLFSGVQNGMLDLNEDGSFTYTPNADFDGTDGFTYSASDGIATSGAVSVTIMVNPVNDDPVANNDSYSLGQDTEFIVNAPGVLGNDSDVDGDPLTASVANGPSHGNLVLNGDGSFTYTPEAGYAGPDTFTYDVTDGQTGTDVGTVALTIAATPAGSHIGDLDGASVNNGSTWTAEITVTVHDGNHSPLANATVNGTWSVGASGEGTGVTGAAGTCTITIDNIPKRESSVTFTITGVTVGTLVYDSDSNHDADGDSNGTVITVNKP